jgi:hypothetical protein
MAKSLDQRISYYTRKVRERVSYPRSKALPANFTYRHERLMTYKRIMNEQIRLTAVN